MADLWDQVIDQEDAVARLQRSAPQPVHAYLFVGPSGTGKTEASVAFAQSLICGCGDCETCERIASGVHPDVMVVERTGAAISVEQAREITRIAARPPLEANRQVIVLYDFHLVDEAASALLKTIEEPNTSTVFIIHAEYIPEGLVTIASRCMRIDFHPLSDEAIAAELIRGGIDTDRAHRIAQQSFGSLRNARRLAASDEMEDNVRFWTDVVDQLDGTGARVVALTSQAQALLDKSVAILEEDQETQRESFMEDAKSRGATQTERKDFDANQKRELRRVRTDTLRFGLLTLAHECKRRATNGSDNRVAFIQAATLAQDAEKRLLRNPNEQLLIDGLLCAIDRELRNARTAALT